MRVYDSWALGAPYSMGAHLATITLFAVMGALTIVAAAKAGQAVEVPQRQAESFLAAGETRFSGQ